MHPQQQPQDHFSSIGLSQSVVSSSPSQLSQPQIRLPPISQRLISRYRNERLPINLQGSNKNFMSSNFFTQIFCGKQSDASVSMCSKCEKTSELQLCSFIMQMVEEKYSWKEDMKFRSSYEFYNKKKMPLFLSDHQIEHRLLSKFTILGIVLLDNHKLLLCRIIKNYLKHTIYYGDEHKLSAENDYYFWFLIGIYYHVGVPKYLDELESLPRDSVGLNQPIMFWTLDMVMKRLGDCSYAKVKAVSELTLQYCQFFYQRQCKCLASYDINLAQIMLEWSIQGMMGYMGIEFIGFFIKSILKQGYEYIQKTIMSYFQKRVVKLDRDQIISFHQHSPNTTMNTARSTHGYQFSKHDSVVNEETKKAKKEQILKVLLDSNEEWPGIFFSTNVYDLKK